MAKRRDEKRDVSAKKEGDGGRKESGFAEKEKKGKK